MRKNKGFTLVELLAVIVILALIMVIAIPAILRVMNNARKQSFYLFAESVYQKAMQKYTSENGDTSATVQACASYDIKTDLDISNTGDYSGYVAITRKQADSGYYQYRLQINKDKPIYNVKWCTAQNKCDPFKETGTADYNNGTYPLEDNATRAIISQSLPDENYYLCVTYEQPDANGKMQKIDAGCTSKSSTNYDSCDNATGNNYICKQRNGSYEYEVHLSLNSNSYAVDNIVMKDENTNGFQDEFYNKMETDTKVDAEHLPVSRLTCDNSGNLNASSKVQRVGHNSSETTIVRSENDDESKIYLSSISMDTYNENNTAIQKGQSIGFKREQLNYYIKVNKNTSYIRLNVNGENGVNVEIPARDSNGNIPLQTGDNIIKINLTKNVDTQENGANVTKTVTNSYVLYVNRAGNENDKTVTTTTETTKVTAPEKITSDQTTAQQVITRSADETTKMTNTAETTKEVTTEVSTFIVSDEASTSIQVQTMQPETTIPTDESVLLDYLGVDGYNLNPEFTPTRLSYDIVVPYEVEFVNVRYKIKDGAPADARISGDEKIAVGKNTITIRVANTETGQDCYYHIYVTRLDSEKAHTTQKPNVTTTTWDPNSGLPDPSLGESNANLSGIQINGYVLEDFDPYVYEYNLDTDGEDSLVVTPYTQDSSASAVVSGQNGLVDGSQIEINVQSGNGFYHKIYKINVHFKEKTTTSTVVIRSVCVGLAALLVVLLAIILNQKKSGKLIKNTGEKIIEKGGYVKPTEVENKSKDNK